MNRSFILVERVGRALTRCLQLLITSVLIFFSFAVFFAMALIRNPRWAEPVARRLAGIYQALLMPLGGLRLMKRRASEARCLTASLPKQSGILVSSAPIGKEGNTGERSTQSGS